MIRRRSFLRLSSVGLILGSAPWAIAGDPIWIAAREVGEFTVVADEIFTADSHLRALDVATGQERRSAKIGKPADAEGPAIFATTGSALVFGWYVWHDDAYIVSADARSLQIRWQRRMKISEREREDIPEVLPLIRSDGLFVLLSNKHSDNLFRLRPDNGETMWSRYVERFAVGASLAWHSGRLLVRSRVARGANAAGDVHAIDPANGSTIWRVRLEGHEDSGRDTMLLSGNRAFVVSPIRPGESSRLYVLDVAAGAVVKSLTIDRLGEPFAYRDGIVYFGGRVPSAWDANREAMIWRTNLSERRDRIVYVTHDPVLDTARQRIYLGESEDSFFVLSSTDGAVVDRVNVRRGRTHPNIMTAYGAYRLRLVRDLLLVGSGDRRLMAFVTTSL